MRLPRVEAAIEDCGRHLSSTGSFGSPIEAVLTSYLSAVIYAAFETAAREIVAERAAGPGSDSLIVSFSRTASVKLMRSVRISELAGIAGLFHGDCKERFQSRVDDEAKNAWDTVILNRHNLAHDVEQPGAVSNLTFGELKTLYPKALPVLEQFRTALVGEAGSGVAAP